MKDSTTRFSGYSSNYEKYRPSYPAAVIQWLQNRTGLGTVVADTGSGTGIFSGLLLQHGNLQSFSTIPFPATRPMHP